MFGCNSTAASESVKVILGRWSSDKLVSVPSSFFLLLNFLLQLSTQLLNVSGYNRQCHISLEPVYPMIQTSIQSVDFQSIDTRFNRRVCAPTGLERFAVLPVSFFFVATTFFG